MANIIFCVPPLAGSMKASIKMAKGLRSNGHQVFYLGIPDCEGYVLPHGFNFISVFDRWFPKGRITPDAMTMAWRDRYRVRRMFVNLLGDFFDALLAGTDGEFEKALDRVKPALFIISPSTYHSIIWALLAYGAGLPVLYLNEILSHPANSLTPPITTSLAPTDRLYSKLRTRLAWSKIFLVRYCYAKALSPLGLAVDWHRVVRRLAAKVNYPWELIDTSDLIAPKLRTQELVLWPTEFDFPLAEQTGRYFVEASIDEERNYPPFPMERIDHCKPLVYCALGTLPCLTKSQYRNFFEAVIAAAAARDDLQWVISTGGLLSPEEFQHAPNNVLIVSQAPQTDILKKAVLMINHGGANTVKECLFYGVPMIVFPLQFDNFGYAARVLFHGLGLKGDIKTSSAKMILEMVEKIERDPYYRAQAKLMKRAFKEREKLELGLKIIEAILT